MIKGYYKEYRISIQGEDMLAVHINGLDLLIGDRRAVSNEIDHKYEGATGMNSSDLTKNFNIVESKHISV